MNIDARGNVSGTLDAVIREVALLPGETYSGSAQVNENCTDTLHFITSRGTERRDTILIFS
jgi:hypothetical protein